MQEQEQGMLQTRGKVAYVGSTSYMSLIRLQNDNNFYWLSADLDGQLKQGDRVSLIYSWMEVGGLNQLWIQHLKKLKGGN